VNTSEQQAVAIKAQLKGLFYCYINSFRPGWYLNDF